MPNSTRLLPEPGEAISAPTVKITEIFYSLQGESRSVGWPTIFIRLTGCPLRCVYCDTAYAFKGGQTRTIDEIITQISQFSTKFVTVTGGEPLAQKNCLTLLQRLCDLDYQVSLETSGALDVSQVDARVSKVMDLKTPASGEHERNLWSNLAHVRAHDQVKFVISNQADYEWSRQMLREHTLDSLCEVLFSPVHGLQDPTELAEWLLQDQLKVRFQLQLHKLLWGDQAGK